MSKNSTLKDDKILEDDDAHVTSYDLDSLNIIEYNEYTGTRQEFWEENYVNCLLRVSSGTIEYYVYTFMIFYFIFRLFMKRN